MNYRPSIRKAARVVGLAVALVVALPAGTAVAASSTVPVKRVSIVSSSSTCSSLFCFKPANVTVANPTKVVWSNTTTTSHTVTRCTVAACGVSGGTGTDTGFGSPGTVSPGAKYGFVFDAPGTYVYYCAIHGYAVMHGTITVS